MHSPSSSKVESGPITTKASFDGPFNKLASFQTKKSSSEEKPAELKISGDLTINIDEFTKLANIYFDRVDKDKSNFLEIEECR